MKVDKWLPAWHDLFPPKIRRPAFLGTCFIFSLLLASGFFAFRQKSDFILWKNRTLPGSWPSPQFWGNMSVAARSPNRCPHSGCLGVPVQNQSRLSDPFNARLTADCPFYFGWIHEDLAPWKTSGITEETLRSGISKAAFRVVIKDGQLYVHPYQRCFETRSIYTVWSLLQLLNLYPGLVPNLELLFWCGDTPRVLKRDYSARTPPPIFSYCGTADTFDIPFPDWSFWGWPEVDLSAWDMELCSILKGENELLWEKRRATAYWKGNTDTGGAIRKNLKKCDGRHHTEVSHLNWWNERRAKYKNTQLPGQCNTRYKIYVEGWGWSVSLKYILACDSPVLLVDPHFFEFFSRALVAKEHFWPIRPQKLCDSIKFGVEWGNNHTVEAEAMGRAGRQFVTKELSMKIVYDYMLHVLREYAKLLKYEPKTENMEAVCSEAFVCLSPEIEQRLYMESMVRKPSDTRPCFLPPRNEEQLKRVRDRNSDIVRGIREAEDLQWSRP